MFLFWYSQVYVESQPRRLQSTGESTSSVEFHRSDQVLFEVGDTRHAVT